MPSKYKIQSKCKNVVKFLPSITPQIYGLSLNSSVTGVYTIINIFGINFSITGPTGYSTVNFGPYLNLPIIFLGSQSIAFEIPTNIVAGTYNLTVENILYPNTLYSNSVLYTLTP
jgi:hypothetical protein